MSARWLDDDEPRWSPEPLPPWLYALLGFLLGVAVTYLAMQPS